MSTQIVSVVSQKGGVGESTIARALAVSYASKRKRVRVLDYDTHQRTTQEWLQARQLNKLKPVLDVQLIDAASEGFGIEAHSPGCDVLIVDAPQTLKIGQLPSGSPTATSAPVNI